MSCTPIDSSTARLRWPAVAGGLLASALMACTSVVLAADDDKLVAEMQAMSWAAACFTCHGAADDVEGSRIGSLAGMPADEFVSKMKELAASTRPGALMPQLARGYDETALVRMGEYFEKLGEAQ